MDETTDCSATTAGEETQIPRWAEQSSCSKAQPSPCESSEEKRLVSRERKAEAWEAFRRLTSSTQPTPSPSSYPSSRRAERSSSSLEGSAETIEQEFESASREGTRGRRVEEGGGRERELELELTTPLTWETPGRTIRDTNRTLGGLAG